ncbi:hypothetical protein ES703_125816 [subsurface metagenome]
MVEDNPPDDEIDIMYSSTTLHKHFVMLPEDAILPVANPPAKASTDGANFSYETLDYDDGTEETAYWERWLTPDYDLENVVADIDWIAAAGAGDVKFGLQVLGRAEGEAWDVALGAEETVISPTGGAGVLNRARISTFAPGWAKEDNLVFKLARKAADDNLVGDAKVLKVVVSYTMQFPQSIYPLAQPQELTLPEVYGSWQDLDLSDHLPIGATGAFFECDCTGVDFGLRKKGSTDDLWQPMLSNSHLGCFVGVDNDRKCQVYRGAGGAAMKLYIHAYTATGVDFLTNAVDITPVAEDAWETEDLSGIKGDAIGFLIMVTDVGQDDKYGVRRFGGNRNAGGAATFASGSRGNWQFVGCDAAGADKQKIQLWRTRASTSFWVIGYITKGVTWTADEDGQEVTPVEVLQYVDVDIDAIIAKATMAILEVDAGDWGGSACAVRKNGLTYDIYDGVDHSWFFCACDQNGIIQLKRADAPADIKFYLLGAATHAG